MIVDRVQVHSCLALSFGLLSLLRSGITFQYLLTPC